MSKAQELAEQTNMKIQKPTPDWRRIPIEGTPFWAIGKDNRYTITMGKYRLHEEPIKVLTNDNDETPENETEIQEAAYMWLRDNQWDVTLKMIAIATTDQKQQDTNKK